MIRHLVPDGLYPMMKRFVRDKGGSTAIEYSLIAAGVGAAIAGTVWNLGTEVKTTFYDKLTNLF